MKTIRTEKLHNRYRNRNPEKEKTEKMRRRKRERREAGRRKREGMEAGRRKSRDDLKRDDSSKVRIYQDPSYFYGPLCPHACPTFRSSTVGIFALYWTLKHSTQKNHVMFVLPIVVFFIFPG